MSQHTLCMILSDVWNLSLSQGKIKGDVIFFSFSSAVAEGFLQAGQFGME